MPLSRALAVLRRVELGLAVALLAGVVAVVLLGTIGRYLGQPVIWSDEVAQAMFVWLSLLAADLTLQRSGHFRIDALLAFLPGMARRVVDLILFSMIAALLALLIHYGWLFAKITSLRPLPMTGVPSSFATAALPIGFALMLLTVIEHAVHLVSGRPVPRPAGQDDEVSGDVM